QLVFEVDTDRRNQRFRRLGRWRVQHLVGRVEYLAEEIELLREDFERQPLRDVAGGQETDHSDAAPLPVPVDATNALLNALWIPGQVVVDDRVAKLEIQAFCASLGRNEHLRLVLELMDERQAQCDVTTRPMRGRQGVSLVGLPLRERALGIGT